MNSALQQESWGIQVATGGWVVSHNWQDEHGNYRGETYVFTDVADLTAFFTDKLTNQE
jgi:hypothetical protein